MTDQEQSKAWSYEKSLNGLNDWQRCEAEHAMNPGDRLIQHNEHQVE